MERRTGRQWCRSGVRTSVAPAPLSTEHPRRLVCSVEKRGPQRVLMAPQKTSKWGGKTVTDRHLRRERVGRPETRVSCWALPGASPINSRPSSKCGVRVRPVCHPAHSSIGQTQFGLGSWDLPRPFDEPPKMDQKPALPDATMSRVTNRAHRNTEPAIHRQRALSLLGTDGEHTAESSRNARFRPPHPLALTPRSGTVFPRQ